MKKLIIYLPLLLALLLSAGIVFAAQIGGVSDAVLVAAVTSRISDDRVGLTIFDLQRALNINVTPRVNALRGIYLFPQPDSLMVLSGKQDTSLTLAYQQLDTRASIELYTDENADSEYTSIFAYRPVQSPDERFYIYQNPNTSLVTINDAATHRQLYTSLVNVPSYSFRAYWAPDSAYVAFKIGDETLLVTTSDGSTEQTIPLRRIGSEYIQWRDDGKLTIVYRNGTEFDIQVIDLEMIHEPILSHQISDVSNLRWCDDNWLTYHLLNEDQNAVYTMNINTGNQFEVLDSKLLGGATALQLNWVAEDCTWLTVEQYIPSTSPGSSAINNRLFLSDRTGKDVTLINQNAAVIDFPGAGGDHFVYRHREARRDMYLYRHYFDVERDSEIIGAVPSDERLSFFAVGPDVGFLSIAQGGLLRMGIYEGVEDLQYLTGPESTVQQVRLWR